MHPVENKWENILHTKNATDGLVYTLARDGAAYVGSITK